MTDLGLIKNERKAIGLALISFRMRFWVKLRRLRKGIVELGACSRRFRHL